MANFNVSMTMLLSRDYMMGMSCRGSMVIAMVYTSLEVVKIYIIACLMVSGVAIKY